MYQVKCLIRGQSMACLLGRCGILRVFVVADPDKAGEADRDALVWVGQAKRGLVARRNTEVRAFYLPHRLGIEPDIGQQRL